MRIGAVVRTQPRVERITLENVIVQLCTLAPLGLNDLETLLERRKRYILVIIRTLLTSDRIDYLYPHQPNHPRHTKLQSKIVDRGTRMTRKTWGTRGRESTTSERNSVSEVCSSQDG
jgi:hypothetical protein